MQSAASVELPVFSARTRLLVVAPHPDDETLATGILIQQVRAAGGVVRVLLLTSGDNNPWPQRWIEHRLRIGSRERERWGLRRQAELHRALDKLHIDTLALQLLGWPDMGLTDCLMNPGHEAVDTLGAAIEDFAPSVVAMPSLEDRHPDHGAAHVMLRLALAKSSCRPQLLAYLVHGQTQGVSYVAIAGSIEQQASKQAALLEHQSQMVLSGKRMRRWADRPERFIQVPTIDRALSGVLPWRPPAWMRSCLRLSLATPYGVQSWLWAKAPLQRESDGSFRLNEENVRLASPCFAKLAWDLHTFWIFDHWGWCEL